MRSMKIILNEDVYNLGEEGDVREVAPGYARNYLIPQGFAVLFDRHHVALLRDKREVIERRKVEKRTSASDLKERIEELNLEFVVPAGTSGKLFGSVTNAAIADRLLQKGFSIERKKIEIPGHNIKSTGEYEVSIKLYADESATLNVTIKAEGAVEAPKSEADDTKKAPLKVESEAASPETSGESASAGSPEAPPAVDSESELDTENAKSEPGSNAMETRESGSPEAVANDTGEEPASGSAADV